MRPVLLEPTPWCNLNKPAFFCGDLKMYAVSQFQHKIDNMEGFISFSSAKKQLKKSRQLALSKNYGALAIL